MKYYIFVDGAIKRVTSKEYREWTRTESKNFAMEFYTQLADKMIGAEIMYYGAIDKGEEILPFVLLYFEDKLDQNQEPTVTYFGTFEEAKKAYLEILQSVEKKIDFN